MGFGDEPDLPKRPGIGITASYIVPNAQMRDVLGRNLAACPSQTVLTCTSDLTHGAHSAEQMFEPRLKQFDLRFSRLFGWAVEAAAGDLDIHNVFNASDVLSMTTDYGSAWKNVAYALSARLLRIGAQLDF